MFYHGTIVFISIVENILWKIVSPMKHCYEALPEAYIIILLWQTQPIYLVINSSLSQSIDIWSRFSQSQRILQHLHYST